MTHEEWRTKAHEATRGVVKAAEDLQFDLGVMSMDCVNSSMEALQAHIDALQEAMEHE